MLKEFFLAFFFGTFQLVTSTAPEEYTVCFNTSVGNFDVIVNRTWSPLGADHFYELVKAEYYDDNPFFRMVKGFVTQWGISSEPATTAKWSKAIKDDPVIASNTIGTITYADAGPNTRTTQLFINYADNAGLDKQGFSPFGIVKADGMNVVNSFNFEYGQKPDQGKLTSMGGAYWRKQFPRLTYINTVRVV